MKLDDQEIATDVAAAISLFFSTKAALAGVPKQNAGVRDYVRALGAVVDTPLDRLAKLIDDLIAQNKT